MQMEVDPPAGSSADATAVVGADATAVALEQAGVAEALRGKDHAEAAIPTGPEASPESSQPGTAEVIAQAVLSRLTADFHGADVDLLGWS